MSDFIEAYRQWRLVTHRMFSLIPKESPAAAVAIPLQEAKALLDAYEALLDIKGETNSDPKIIKLDKADTHAWLYGGTKRDDSDTHTPLRRVIEQMAHWGNRPIKVIACWGGCLGTIYPRDYFTYAAERKGIENGSRRAK